MVKKIIILGDGGGSVTRTVLEAQAAGAFNNVAFINLAGGPKIGAGASISLDPASFDPRPDNERPLAPSPFGAGNCDPADAANDE